MIPERTVCITLERRHDRWGRFIESFPKDWPFPEVQKFIGFDGQKMEPPKSWGSSRGGWGATLSHLAVIQTAYDEGIESLLVLEDDALPVQDLAESWRNFDFAGKTWDWLYLGGQIKGRIETTPTLVRPFRCIRAHAYILKRKAMKLILDRSPDWTDVMDHEYARIHTKRELSVLCVQPWLFNVRGERSDIFLPHQPTVVKKPMPKKIILTSKHSLCPGDILTMTAVVRDLHKNYPGQYITDVVTSYPELWEHNPYVTPLDSRDADVTRYALEYPLIHESNTSPYHMIHGFAQNLEKQLGVRIPLKQFKGDIHISEEEKGWLPQVEEEQFGHKGDFWIMMAGGKYDFTTKWWSPDSYQAVVDHFKGKIQFVHPGLNRQPFWTKTKGGGRTPNPHAHWHPELSGVIDLTGKANLRQLIRLMYHAKGVVCPITFVMHLAAATPTTDLDFPNRPCVVIAGGREAAHWEAYPHHQFISTNGMLSCCANGGCWKARAKPLGDGTKEDLSLCEKPVHLDKEISVPYCMNMITPTDVIRRIEMYYEGR